MNRTGEVTKVKPGMVRVAFCRPEACAKCGACEGGKKETVLWLKGEAKVGDIAVVDIGDGVVINASVIAYLLPLVCFLAGFVAGNLLFHGSELAEILCALGGLSLAAVLIVLTEKKRRKDPRWMPEIVEIIPGNERNEQNGNQAE